MNADDERKEVAACALRGYYSPEPTDTDGRPSFAGLHSGASVPDHRTAKQRLIDTLRSAPIRR